MGNRVRIGMEILRYEEWPLLVERVERYEALGLDAFWVPDHFVVPWNPKQPWFDGWSLLAALAARTSRIRLGTLVTHAIYRNPAVLARAAITIDEVSGGRFEIGMGTGASDHDWRMTMASEPWPFQERVARFAEAVEVVDGLLRGTMQSYSGQFYQVADVELVPRPVQRPRPRLLVAASGPRMIKLAARFGDAWVTEGNYRDLWGVNATAGDVLRLTQERWDLLREEAQTQGRDPDEIDQVFLAGFAAGAREPWASVGAAEEIIGRYRELGFREFVFPEPEGAQWGVFERLVTERVPAL